MVLVLWSAWRHEGPGWQSGVAAQLKGGSDVVKRVECGSDLSAFMLVINVSTES